MLVDQPWVTPTLLDALGEPGPFVCLGQDEGQGLGLGKGEGLGQGKVEVED
jgi:hypothetical protein